MSEPTEQSFLKDVAEHRMLTLRDDELYRHIRFKRPASGSMHFDLITWPGVLCYTGDMGTYVFSRVADMFSFFRTDKSDWNYNKSGGLSINRDYWSEKLIAVDGSRHEAGATEFNKDRFLEVINKYRVSWIRDGRFELSKAERRELWEEVDQQVVDRLNDGRHVAEIAANEFIHRIGRRTFTFDDLWDHDFTKFTYRFTWCCYALAWGIRTYDEARAKDLAAA